MAALSWGSGVQKENSLSSPSSSSLGTQNTLSEALSLPHVPGSVLSCILTRGDNTLPVTHLVTLYEWGQACSRPGPERLLQSGLQVPPIPLPHTSAPWRAGGGGGTEGSGHTL